MTRTSIPIWFVALALSFTGCGGGDSGGTQAAPPPSYLGRWSNPVVTNASSVQFGGCHADLGFLGGTTVSDVLAVCTYSSIEVLPLPPENGWNWNIPTTSGTCTDGETTWPVTLEGTGYDFSGTMNGRLMVDDGSGVEQYMDFTADAIGDTLYLRHSSYIVSEFPAPHGSCGYTPDYLRWEATRLP